MYQAWLETDAGSAAIHHLRRRRLPPDPRSRDSETVALPNPPVKRACRNRRTAGLWSKSVAEGRHLGTRLRPSWWKVTGPLEYRQILARRLKQLMTDGAAITVASPIRLADQGKTTVAALAWQETRTDDIRAHYSEPMTSAKVAAAEKETENVLA